VKDVICEETARLGLQVYRDCLRAVVLTGSLARNEGTFVEDTQCCLLLGDAEFLLVFSERAVLPSDADIAVIRKKIEERIHRRGVRAEISLGAVRPNYLRQLPASIFAYELKACGKVVAGDPHILALIPEFTRDEIPLEDAWRLLANRLVEQLKSVDEVLERRLTLSPSAHYRTVKLYLDMATSLLVFAGGYAPTYEERARNLGKLMDSPSGATSWPFPLKTFTDDVVMCTKWKLCPSCNVLDADQGFWERAIDYAQALWRWELAGLQRCEPNVEPAELMGLWMRRQPFRYRLRGWAYVVRKHGWRRSWREWSRWLRQFAHASPRHLVYATGSTVVFELRAARESRLVPGLERLAHNLPVTAWPGPNGNRSPLQSLAESIVQNYKHFVVETRA
jgi:hypothetical protein